MIDHIKRGFRKGLVPSVEAIHSVAWLCSLGKLTGRRMRGLRDSLQPVLPD